VKLLTVCHHTGLSRLRGLDAIACRCSCSCRWLACGGRGTDEGYADVDACLHAGAVIANSRVPFHKVSKANMVVACDLAADDTRGHVVELGAIGDHAWLSGLGSLNAVSCASGRRRFRSSGGSGSADNTNADVDFSPHTRAVGKDRGVPLK
jgi:hypothetical protein